MTRPSVAVCDLKSPYDKTKCSRRQGNTFYLFKTGTCSLK